jgi:hypothetical protein
LIEINVTEKNNVNALLGAESEMMEDVVVMVCVEQS